MFVNNRAIVEVKLLNDTKSRFSFGPWARASGSIAPVTRISDSGYFSPKIQAKGMDPPPPLNTGAPP